MFTPDQPFFIPISIGIAVLSLIFYAIANAAVVSFERCTIQSLTEHWKGRSSKLKKAEYHLEHPQRYVSTMSLVKIIFSIIPAVVLCVYIAPYISIVLPDWSVWNKIISCALVLFGMALVWLFFGSMLPRKITANIPDKTFFRVMGIINVFAVLLRPVTFVLGIISNGIVKLFGMDPHLEDMPVTEEQVLRLIDESEEDGQISGMEADMIENIFDFNDTAVSEIMTHRKFVTAVNDFATINDVVKIAVQKGYSRIPVFHEHIDHIVGVVYVKDLLSLIGKPLSGNLTAKYIMRKPYLVPSSKPTNKLFAEMTDNRIQFAVLIDEYGGTAGIVTMEDILESIVGTIQDEYDNETESVFKVSDNVFTVDGSMPVDEVEDLLDHELPKGDYDTIAGLVLDQLGNLPNMNEDNITVTVDNIEFTVLEYDDNRIERILIKRNLSENEDE